MPRASNVAAGGISDRVRLRPSSEVPGPEAWLKFLAWFAPRLQPPDRTGDEEVLLETVLDGVRYSLRRAAVTRHPAAPVALSARELEIASMVAKGYTNKTIAAVLEISLWTVDTYLRRIYKKLNVRSRGAMVGRLAADGTVNARETPDWTEAWRTRVLRE